MHAGADFIKTSTGKVQPAATLPVTLVMLEAIRDFYLRDRQKDRHEAGRRDQHGEDRAAIPRRRSAKRSARTGCTPDLFRIGASRLANDILMQLVKEQSGVYQSLDYFSKD